MDTRPHLDVSATDNLYVYITSDYNRVTEQVEETLIENMAKYDDNCAFNIRLDNFQNYNDNGWDNPFTISEMMPFDLLTW